MTLRAALICLIFALCTAAYAQTPPLVEGFHTTTKRTDYNLEGNSITALNAEKDAKGPLDKGKRFFAHTHWDILWNYRYEPKDGGFVITVLSVTAEIHYTLPRRVLPPGVRDQVAAQWARFFAATSAHERGHAENAERRGKALYNLLRKHRVFASAEELEAFISAEGAKCVAEATAADVEFDRQTDHGAKQGATLR